MLKRALLLGSLVLLTTLLFTSCATRVAPQMSQLQVRSIQTREFATSDVKLVMKAMMNVLQDEGFVIKNAHLDLGLVSAEKVVDTQNKNALFRAYCALSGPDLRYEKHMVIEASANVSEFGDRTRVRMNFQEKRFDNVGNIKEVQSVLDEEYYLTFFSNVSKALFIEQEQI